MGAPGAVVAGIVAVAGGALLLAPGGDSELDGVALGAGLSYAVYTVAGEGGPASGAPGPTVMATFFLGGALLLALRCSSPTA